MEYKPQINPYQTLPQWIIHFDKRFISSLDLKEGGHQYFKDTYKTCYNIRNDFHSNFLPKFESNLGSPSSPKFYKYEYFFKTQHFPEFDLAGEYFYDGKINLLRKNYSTNNILKETEKNFNNNNMIEKMNKSTNKNDLQNKKNNINVKNDKMEQNIKNKNDKEIKKENIIYKKTDVIFKRDNNEKKNNQKVIGKKNENFVNKNLSNKNNIQNNTKTNTHINQKNIIKNNTKLNEINNSSIKKEKENNIIKNKINKNNNINKISQAYNKNIIPIKEESFNKEMYDSDENQKDIKNKEIKTSQKIKINNNEKSNIISKNKIVNNSSSYIQKNTNNKIYIKPSEEQIKLPKKIVTKNESNKEPELINVSNKRNSIKNYLLLKKSKFLEDMKDNNDYEENNSKKVTDNINHTRIKNYLSQKSKDIEDEKINENNIIINKNSNNTITSRKKIRESRSSYDIFKKAPFVKK